MSYASDALIDALTHENEQIKSENTKLRNELEDQEGYDQMLRDRLRQQTELCVKAEDENKRLCNERERLFRSNVEKNGEILRLLEENAKLHKLMNTMRKTLDSAESDVCSHCDFFGNCADNDWHECEFDKRMRELGIEV